MSSMYKKMRTTVASATVAIRCWELAAISHVYDGPNELTQIKYSLLILDRSEYKPLRSAECGPPTKDFASGHQTADTE